MIARSLNYKFMKAGIQITQRADMEYSRNT